MDFDIASNLNWIGEHIWAALKQMGGVAILTVIMTFITHKINTRFEKRIEHKYDQKLEELKVELDKQRESHKSLLEKRNYVSKTRFDTEFAVCKELMMSCKSMIDSVSSLFPNEEVEQAYERDKKWDGKNQKTMSTAGNAIKTFEELLEGNSPFIPKDVYNEFKTVDSLCRKNMIAYLCRNENDPLFKGISDDKRKQIIEDSRNRNATIQRRVAAIADMLRDHFQNMEIQE